MLLIMMGTSSIATAAGQTTLKPQEHAVVAEQRARLESIRASGDRQAARHHAWTLFDTLASDTAGRTWPFFEGWFSEAETFEPEASAGVMPPFTHPAKFRSPAAPGHQGVPGAPLITYVHFNASAYQHIREHRLFDADALRGLAESGASDPEFRQARTIPALPASAIALKTGWWPVAAHGVTALPVWDADANDPRVEGNDYSTWSRVIGVAPERRRTTATSADLEFMGRRITTNEVVGLDAFVRVELDDDTARRVMQDPAALRAAQLALGRPLQAGDYLLLVALHLATREIDDWVWATFWWHDRPDTGPFSSGRPKALPAPWNQYLMSETLDFNQPTERDGTPAIAFNPWLEARFPDAGMGSGVVSNCMACHVRASYPPVDFASVLRGTPLASSDPAMGAGQVRTNFLWSIPIQAQ
ncbi:hypothetical protein B1810_14265 [Panacagrimonas perspica]|nr:hypothetical protein B1810_14265 [Panacagrimonas perspica]